MSRKSELRSKKRINLVDAVIAVIFMLALVVATYLTVSIAFADETSDNEVKTQVEYRLRIENVEVERFGISLDHQSGTAKCDFLQIGDVLYNAGDNEQIGKLTSLQYENATGSTGVTDSEGNLVYADYPGRVNLILIVRYESVSDASLPVRVGRDLSFHTVDYTATAKVLSVESEVK